MVRKTPTPKNGPETASASVATLAPQNGRTPSETLRYGVSEAIGKPDARRGRPSTFGEAERNAAFLAYVAGDSTTEIAARIGCSARTVRDWVRDGGWKRQLQSQRETVQGLEAQILRLSRKTDLTTAQAQRLAMLTKSLDRLKKSVPAPKPRPIVQNAVSAEVLARVLDPSYGLYAYQIDFLQSEDRFRIVLKARQIGFSYVVGLAVLLGALAGRPQIVVSASERQAQIILNYARLHAGRLDILIEGDKKDELTVAGTRIIAVSTNFRTAQGWPGDVWFDEFAWVRQQKLLFAALVPSITAMDGRVTIFSTPFTPGSLFWEIATNHRGRYNQWRRWTITLQDAIDQGMPLEGGIDVLRDLFDSESWAMFYQCQWAEDGTALLSWSLLHELTHEAIDPARFGRLHGGVDVGRINDRTAIALIGQEVRDGAWQDRFALVHHESHKGVTFDGQRQAILDVDGRYHIDHWGIDRTGIGMQLAEELCAKWPERFEGVWFSAQRKSRLALNLLKLAEEKRLILPNDPDVLAQLHAVKKQVSGQTIKYDADRTEDGHGDMFWAVAIAAEGRAGGATGGGVGVWVF